MIILVTFTFICKQHLELFTEVSSRDAVQEKVNTIIDVKYRPREVEQVLCVQKRVHFVITWQDEEFVPDDGVGDVKGDEAEGNGDEDEGKLETYDALLGNNLAFPVSFVPNEQFPNDKGVEYSDDNERQKGDGDPKHTVKHERQVLVSIATRTRGRIEVSRLAHLAQERFEGTANQRHHEEREHDFPWRPDVTDIFPLERMAHTNVSLEREAGD